MKPPAAFLDRDGVINRAIVNGRRPHPPQTLDDLQILPGVEQALTDLKRGGLAVVIVTNQPDVARHRQSREVVEAMHAHLQAHLPIDEVRVCYHDDVDGCACRKPQPGLLVDPPTYDLTQSVLVGDRWRDIEAGVRAGVAATILIDYDYDEPMTAEPTARVASLPEAAAWILAHRRRPNENPQ